MVGFDFGILPACGNYILYQKLNRHLKQQINNLWNGRAVNTFKCQHFVI